MYLEHIQPAPEKIQIVSYSPFQSIIQCASAHPLKAGTAWNMAI